MPDLALLGSCLVSLHFQADILCSGTVQHRKNWPSIMSFLPPFDDPPSSFTQIHIISAAFHLTLNLHCQPPSSIPPSLLPCLLLLSSRAGHSGRVFPRFFPFGINRFLEGPRGGRTRISVRTRAGSIVTPKNSESILFCSFQVEESLLAQ